MDKHATRAAKENNKAQTHMQFCEVMAMSLIYNPWVIEDGDAEEAGAENDGRTHIAHPHDKKTMRFRRKCVGCNT